MKTYSLAPVPTCAGLYYITNKRTKEIYVGQSNGLRRRHMEWKNALSSGFGHTNSIMFDALNRNPDLDEWVFVIAKEMPGASVDELLQAEIDEIIRLQSIMPDKVLNQQAGKTGGIVPVGGHILIITPEGAVVGQAVAARLLSRNVDTIKEKARWLRDNGVMQINLEDLIMDRRKILEKYKSTL